MLDKYDLAWRDTTWVIILLRRLLILIFFYGIFRLYTFNMNHAILSPMIVFVHLESTPFL